METAAADLPIRARWEHFPHPSDIGVRGIGATREEAFAQAAMALTAVVTDPALIAPRDAIAIEAEGADDDLLFMAWLDALIYEMATRRMLFSRFEPHIDAGRLRATLWGEAVDVAKHRPAVEIKAATFSELKAQPLPGGGWLAQCVVDV
ncbi:MAG TPA: archease [Rhodocyclaceae bacterium]|nr:MAG: archease [Betaproteobacteria bacterium CG2_30_68_42]PIV71896.1 MAG: archease [Rhodocyclales bacterium CG17_big_fil_post_rev_8_21_14_2_50_68_7]PIX74236.1 MAG: archease [Rhodocyclales bacterium CG_4_10_14_3_um_filter_68_10]PJA58897.1 MAG: archease [Rhodocyclales bacterium CG_4_9_14_3_um_filter_68_10]HCX34197.1 archease [Rhodocyclaceae bacterium]